MNKVILILVLMIIAISCDKDHTISPGGDTQFTGITRTDAIGNVYGVDTNDWRPFAKQKSDGSHEMPGNCNVNIAVYPNPCDDEITINYSNLPTGNKTLIYDFYDKPGHLISRVKNPVYSASDLFTNVYLDSVLKSALPCYDKIFRVYITLIDSAGEEYITFGDIQVNLY